MKLLRSKVWSILDIGCLKWSCILFGMVAGAYLSEFTKKYVWLFLSAALILAIRPMISYFGGEE